jgi:FixJ family two-component response regulator
LQKKGDGDIGMNASTSAALGMKASSTAGVPSVVFVVDDDISVRESLELLIAAAGWRPELFASAQEFLSRPPPSGASCLILDVNLPDLSGLDLQKRIAANFSGTPIIFITGYGDIPTTVQAMKAGAVEFLTKPYTSEALMSAVRSALERSRIIVDERAGLEMLKTRHRSLTPREKDVLALVVRGQLNKQVGGELGISEITVKAHRGHVMRKMHAKSFAELVNMARRLGIETAGGD